MTERPILFSTPMVRALLDGTKTQTRRIVKPMTGLQSKWLDAKRLAKVPSVEVGKWDCGFGVALTHPGGGPGGWIRCPYGEPGDQLWVRETWAHFTTSSGDMPGHHEVEFSGVIPKKPSRNIAFRADDGWEDGDGYGPWKPAIHMPRWASRLSLRITSVRVERLCSISEADAQAEGCELGATSTPPSYRAGYATLWEAINGAGSWNANPWVWVLTFEKWSVASTHQSKGETVYCLPQSPG